jgi:hypothetical protein
VFTGSHDPVQNICERPRDKWRAAQLLARKVNRRPFATDMIDIVDYVAALGDQRGTEVAKRNVEKRPPRRPCVDILDVRRDSRGRDDRGVC